jgi:hypothetical protein
MAVPPPLETVTPGTRVQGNWTKMHCLFKAGVIVVPLGKDLEAVRREYGREAVVVMWDNGPTWVEFVENLQPE